VVQGSSYWRVSGVTASSRQQSLLRMNDDLIPPFPSRANALGTRPPTNSYSFVSCLNCLLMFRPHRMQVFSSLQKNIEFHIQISIYPTKGWLGSPSTKLDSGVQKRLRRSPIEGYGPHHQATARLARAAVVPQASAQSSVRTWTAGHCTGQRASPVGTFSTWAILHRFPNFYTLMVEIFRLFYIHSRLPMTPLNHEKFHGYRSACF